MDTDIKILMILLFAAFLWWFKLALDENKDAVRASELQEKEKRLRAKRVKQLLNKQ